MGLFSKETQNVEEIKNNTSLVIEDEEEKPVEKKEEYDEVYDKEDDKDEETVEEEQEEDSKDIKWLKKAIESGYDEKKIINVLKRQKLSKEKLDEMLEIYNDLVEEEFPELEGELPEIEEETVIPNKEEVQKLDNKLNEILSHFDFRISKIESYLFRGQNEFSNI